MPKKSTVLAVGALTMALLGGGTAAASALHKDVTLKVDGKTVPAGAFALTVSDVLASQGITVGDRDLVYPALDDTVSDGETITVAYSRPVTLTVDGSPVTIHTTATTLDAALGEFQLRELGQSKLSISRSAALPREGLSVDVTTPKQVTLKVGGKKQDVTTTSDTVADLLAEQGVILDADDVLKPVATTDVTAELTVTVDRVEVTTKTKTEKIPFQTTTRKNSSLWLGESKLLQSGKDGEAKRTYEITKVNGKVKQTKRI
ncbi:MAG: ubiquitin-like domain-containing protein, partial [Propionicimonas sp.]|nr:ubiquitin-like domain-containing protein [Propionicimonas sp.]